MAVKRWKSGLRSSPSFIITTICLGLFTECYTYSIVIPILPRALVDLTKVPQEDVQYWINIQLVAFATVFLILSPFVGYISDHVGSRRTFYIFGLLGGITSIIIYMLAVRSPQAMVVARSMLGFSDAMAAVIGLAIIKDTADKSKTVEALGYAKGSMESGMLLGPAVGGFLYDKCGYTVVFILPIFLHVIDLVMRLLMIENPTRERRLEANECDNEHDNSSDNHSHVSPMDESNGVQATERDPLIDNGSRGNSSPSLTSSAISLLPPTSSSLIERFPVLLLLGNARMIVALSSTLVDFIVIMAMETTLPLFVMRLFRWGPTQAGLLIFGTNLPRILVSFTGGRLIDLQQSSLLPVLGASVAAVSLILQRFVNSNTITSKVLIVVLLIARNISSTVVSLIMSAEIGLAAQETENQIQKKSKMKLAAGLTGQGYAFFSMTMSVGSLIGPLIGGLVIEKLGWGGVNLILGTMSASIVPGILTNTRGGLRMWRRKDTE